MAGSNNLVVNPTFIWGSDHGWYPLCCSLSISDKPPECGGPPSGHQFYCVANNRTQAWQGIAQDVTSRFKAGVEYNVEACVSISGPIEVADVRATLKLEYEEGKVTYANLASGSVSKREWAFLKGKMKVLTAPVKATVYLEGPPVGVDLLASCFSIALSNPEPERSIKEPMDLDVEGNVLVNSIFSTGVQGWSGNCCKVMHSGLQGWKGIMGPRGKPFAIVSDRTEVWQGIQQDITPLVQPNETYLVTAMLRTEGAPHEGANVLATVSLEYGGSDTRYLSVGRVKASSTEWVILEGKLLLDTRPNKAVFYLEGPPNGVDLLVSTVVIKPVTTPQGSSPKKQVEEYHTQIRVPESILHNATFANGLQSWNLNGCKGVVCNSLENPKVRPLEGKSFAVVNQRTATWAGIEQTITDRIDLETMYDVVAAVRISGPCSTSTVRASLYIKEADNSERYSTMGSVEANSTEWKQLKGRLILLKAPTKVSVYLEGPPPGTDILVDSFYIQPASKPEPAKPPIITDPKYGVNVVENSNLQHGLKHWNAKGSARLSIFSGAPTSVPPAAALSLPCPPYLSGNCIVASNRTQYWEGPAQTITDKLELFVVYQVSAWVRVGNSYGKAGQKVNVALGIDGKWVTGGEVEVDENSWKEIMGSFRLEKKPKEAVVYAQGPEPGVDLMLAGLQIFAVDRTARIPILKTQADKIRKRDVVLKLTNRGNRPIPPGISVRIEQTSRSFPLGSCISRFNLDNNSYKEFFLQNFNWAVFENEFKWNWTEPQRGTFNYKDADEMVAFCSQHQIPMRGHCIFWECEHNCQDWLKTLTPTELADALQHRAVDLLTRYKGKFQHYDVNNEMLHGCFYRDRLNPDILPYMFKLAHQFDPEAVLFVNDYHVCDGEDANSAADKYAEQVKWLLKEGAPVGGIGVQGHVDIPIGPIVCNSLNKLSTVGIPIWMTEIDVAAENEHIRADDLEVLLRESFAHPSVEGIMLWGFWEGAISRKNGHLVDSDKRINAAGKRLISLREEWTTKLQGSTGDCGQFPFRGYHGCYKTFVNFGELGEIVVDFEVPKGDSPLVLELSLA
ncbi:hypothetical protein KC19_11G087700 [Ceratodon purpureus]|uniref:GH10 domain-containing protein n=1 Tax=Ceratodon purpureus TaxID=3225 RepID=A0A8T0GCX5_CERPU|nr:hypothetical protein KC19_11G087700 [Ceratodon purpureus]